MSPSSSSISSTVSNNGGDVSYENLPQAQSGNSSQLANLDLTTPILTLIDHPDSGSISGDDVILPSPAMNESHQIMELNSLKARLEKLQMELDSVRGLRPKPLRVVIPEPNNSFEISSDSHSGSKQANAKLDRKSYRKVREFSGKKYAWSTDFHDHVGRFTKGNGN